MVQDERMKPTENPQRNKGRGWDTRIARWALLEKAALCGALLMATSCMADVNCKLRRDYSRLVELIKLQDKKKPLYVFNDYEEELDEDTHKANLEYFNDHQNLIRKIKEDLGGGEIRWSLDTLVDRLLFVPEIREEYGTIYENYCNEVIYYVLDRTKLDNPYEKIQTLQQERPEIPDSRVTAFLVHNIAKEFVGRYIFSNKRHKKARIELTGIVYLGQVGSYTTGIFLRDDGRFEFVRNNYTIWQNSAKNPYTALMVPVEETLHIALREYTESAIKEQLERNSVNRTEEVEDIVEDWIAIEEAIVGGLVHTLLPPFIKRCVPNFPYSLIEEDMESKGEFEKYRHLEKGIKVVESVGYEKALKMYLNDPMEFKKLLM